MANNKWSMDDYIDVAERIQEFRDKHPDGSLQQVDLRFMEFAGKSWVVFTAAAYRTPDDPRPGQGTAWEQVPGATNFTRDSEVQNAETAAWGRAIVAALAADTKRGVASAQEVRNQQPSPPPDTKRAAEGPVAPAGTQAVLARFSALSATDKRRFRDKWPHPLSGLAERDVASVTAILDTLAADNVKGAFGATEA